MNGSPLQSEYAKIEQMYSTALSDERATLATRQHEYSQLRETERTSELGQTIVGGLTTLAGVALMFIPGLQVVGGLTAISGAGLLGTGIGALANEGTVNNLAQYTQQYNKRASALDALRKQQYAQVNSTHRQLYSSPYGYLGAKQKG